MSSVAQQSVKSTGLPIQKTPCSDAAELVNLRAIIEQNEQKLQQKEQKGFYHHQQVQILK